MMRYAFGAAVLSAAIAALVLCLSAWYMRRRF
jgi:hypothetical protein